MERRDSNREQLADAGVFRWMFQTLAARPGRARGCRPLGHPIGAQGEAVDHALSEGGPDPLNRSSSPLCVSTCSRMRSVRRAWRVRVA
jgi:hypothetical protein